LNVLIVELRVGTEHAAPTHAKKKADVVEYPWVIDHIGLLFNEPPGMPGLPFI
jgi:hypothetical protein